MAPQSAGILLYKFVDGDLNLMLVHPGGPFWANRDDGAWSIPKGIFENEEPLEAAKREFKEETGFDIEGAFIELGKVKQPSRKIVYAWALEKDLNVSCVVSNTFTMEWPKKSGNIREFPEIDKAQWFDVPDAKRKILKGQVAFINTLVSRLQFIPPKEFAASPPTEPEQGSLF